MAKPFEMESKYVLPHTRLVEKLDDYTNAAGETSSATCGIYGLFGAGKSGFLKSYFTTARCQALAGMKQLYPRVITFRNPEPDQLFGIICETLVQYVNTHVPEEDRPAFPSANGMDPQKRLTEMVMALHQGGYHVTVVLDEFHRISQSETIENAHYEKFRNLHEDAATELQYIVATDVDVDPKNTTHSTAFITSFFVHVFDDNFITAWGMTREEFDGYIAGFFAEDEPPFFTEEEMALLFSLTGGLPRIARKTASLLYRLKSKKRGTEDIRRRALEEVRDQFDDWCETLMPWPKALLKKILAEGFAEFYEGDEKDAFDRLLERGFVIEEPDEDGNEDTGNYRLCCELFSSYIEQKFDTEYNAIYSKEATAEISEKQKKLLEDVRSLSQSIQETIDNLSGLRRVKWTVTKYTNLKERLSALESELTSTVLDEPTLRRREMEYDDIENDFEE